MTTNSQSGGGQTDPTSATNVFPALPFPHVTRPVAIDYHNDVITNKTHIYWVDTQDNAIHRALIDATEVEKVIDAALGMWFYYGKSH